MADLDHYVHVYTEPGSAGRWIQKRLAEITTGVYGDAVESADDAALLAYLQSVEDDPVQTFGWGFDVAVTPTVTNGAYSAGDIIGGLMTFANVARAIDEAFLITGVAVAIKAAVMPNPLTLILFSADPTATTKTDNAAYSLNAADTFKVIKSIPFQTLGAAHYDHGTPNTISLDNLNVVALPASGTRDIYGLLVDATGVTLTSTSDVQVRVRGAGV